MLQVTKRVIRRCTILPKTQYTCTSRQQHGILQVTERSTLRSTLLLCAQRRIHTPLLPWKEGTSNDRARASWAGGEPFEHCRADQRIRALRHAWNQHARILSVSVASAGSPTETLLGLLRFLCWTVHSACRCNARHLTRPSVEARRRDAQSRTAFADLHLEPAGRAACRRAFHIDGNIARTSREVHARARATYTLDKSVQQKHRVNISRS